MISAGVRPVRSCAHRLNRLSLNPLAHPVSHGVDRRGTSSSMARPAERETQRGAPPSAIAQPYSTLRDRASPGQNASSLRAAGFCLDTSDGTVVRYATGRRAHLGSTRLVCPPCLRHAVGGPPGFWCCRRVHWRVVSTSSETGGTNVNPKRVLGGVRGWRVFLPHW